MTATVYEALAEIQSRIAVPKGRSNDFGGYKYRKAEDIIAAARSAAPSGCIIKTTDRIEEIGGQIFVIATASITFAGETISADAGAMHPLQKKGMDASQITGSASSYARKYALQGLFALDDVEQDPDVRDNRQENGNAAISAARAEADALCLSLSRAKDTAEINEIWGAEAASRKRIYDADPGEYDRVKKAASDRIHQLEQKEAA